MVTNVINTNKQINLRNSIWKFDFGEKKVNKRATFSKKKRGSNIKRHGKFSKHSELNKSKHTWAVTNKGRKPTESNKNTGPSKAAEVSVESKKN